MTSSSHPSTLRQYLARRCFKPAPANPAWRDRATGQQVIRVLHHPGETTLLYCLDQSGCCLYEAVFSPGTPDTLVIAAIHAALTPPLPQAGGKRAMRPASTR